MAAGKAFDIGLDGAKTFLGLSKLSQLNVISKEAQILKAQLPALTSAAESTIKSGALRIAGAHALLETTEGAAGVAANNS